MTRTTLVLFTTACLVATSLAACGARGGGHGHVVVEAVPDEAVYHDHGEAYLVEDPQVARDLVRAERLQAREEARAAKLHAHEMRRAQKIALREQRRAEKLAVREQRRAEKLQRRWMTRQQRQEARSPNGVIVAPPPMAPSLPSFPYATPRVERGVHIVDAHAPRLSDALHDAIQAQRGWRGLAPVPHDEGLAAAAMRYARALAEAEVVPLDTDLTAALRDAERAIAGLDEAAFVLDADADPHAVVAWLADSDADRHVILGDSARAMGVGAATFEGVRVVVVLSARGDEDRDAVRRRSF